MFYKQTTKADGKTKSRYACIVAEPDANGDLRVDMRYVTGMNERGFLPGNTATLEEVIQNRTAEGRALHLDQPTEESIAQSSSSGNGQAKMSVDGQTQTRQFKEWFVDSKIVDGDGKPMVVYRGSAFELS